MEAEQYWPLLRSDYRNTLVYAHTISRTVLTCDVSIGSLILPAPEAGDFVELLLYQISQYVVIYFYIFYIFGTVEFVVYTILLHYRTTQ